MEDHPLDRNLGTKGFEQVPGNGFAFPILISSQIELTSVLQQLLEFLDLSLLVLGHDIERLEVVFGVNTEPGPRLRLVAGGDLGGVSRQVADMTDAGLDDVSVAEVAGNRPGLGW